MLASPPDRPPPALVNVERGEPVVVLTDVGKNFGERVVLRHTSLTLFAGERVAITGPSGSGKSTLLHLIGGLDEDFSGTISICGQGLKGLSASALASLRNETIGFVFQSFHLIEHLSVLENVLLPAAFDRRKRAHKELLAHAESLLSQVSMLERRHDLPTRLSGGQKQRVAIARALILGPRLLLCDEPTGNLDEGTAEQVLSLLDALAEGDRGLTMIFVTHEEKVVRREGIGRVFCLVDGKLGPIG